MTEEIKPARVRFAPSPTGRVHLGSGRTALYDYLLARQTGGQFVLRIEDTDRARYVPGAEQEIMDGLHWLGIDWDEGPDKGGPYGPYRQSERKEIYSKVAEQLVDMGAAYYCFCTPARLEELHDRQRRLKQTPHYDKHCRNIPLDEAKARVAAGEPHTIRFKTPEIGTTMTHDLIRGDIVTPNKTLDDFILVKTDGWALYHLAAMVDDHMMKITHVIRGSEWLPTFPLHHLIYQALGWDEPTFIHLSVFLKPNGKGKMSKRDASEAMKDHHSIFLTDFAPLGYIPEGVVNGISLMGWSYDDKTQIFTMPELIEKFSLEHLNPSPAAIDFKKLDNFNGVQIRMLENDDLAKRVKPFFEEDGKKNGYTVDDALLKRLIPSIKTRMETLDDGPDIAGFFFKKQITVTPEELIQKDTTAAQCADFAERSIEILSKQEELKADVLEPLFRNLVEELGVKTGQLFGLIREAVTGAQKTPPLFDTMELIGKDTCIERLKTAEDMLRRNVA